MLNEKGLAAAIKADYKGTGYTVSRFRDRFFLRTDRYAVSAEMDKLPRKVLGLIVEHVGDVPQNGSAWKLQNKVEQQTVMAQMEVEAFEEHRQHLADAQIEAKPTPLSYGGYAVWQERRELKCFLLPPDLLRMIDKPELEADYFGGSVCWSDAGWSAEIVTGASGNYSLDPLHGYPWSGE